MSTDNRDDLGPLEPGLDKLFRVLASAPTRDELAGEQDALTMFRAARQSAPAGGAAQTGGAAQAGGATQAGGASQATTIPPRPAAPAAERARRQRIWGIRRTVAVATVAFVAGFAAAAYAEVLPAPVQHVAYKVLGWAAVPDAPAQHKHPQSGHTPGSTPAGGGSSHPATGPSSTPASSASPGHSRASSPRPSKSMSLPPPPQLSAATSASQIAAGGSVTITASATRHGHGASGVRVILQEVTPKHLVWTQVARGKTGRNGQAVLTVSDLTVNAAFRVTAVGSAPSAAVPVTVVPQVTASVLTRPGGRKAVIKVVCRYAQPGNIVVLQVYRDGGWVPVRAHRIGGLLKTGFVVKVLLTKTRTLRVVLHATRLHAKAVSNEVTVGPRV